MNGTTTLLLVNCLLIVFIPFVLMALYVSRIRKVGPNEAMVISGRRVRNRETGEIESYRIIKGGGRVFLWPALERMDVLSLELMSTEVVIRDAYTRDGVAVTLEGVAQIKIAGDDGSIRAAAERFLSKSPAEIQSVARDTLVGHLRTLIGTLTAEEIDRERDKLTQSVRSVSASDLHTMGLSIDSFVIKDVKVSR